MANDNPLIEARLTPPDLIQRMAKYPDKLAKETRGTLEKANYHVWASVPPYPAKPPNSTYDRKGSGGLGGSLGSSEKGGKGSKTPHVFKVKRLGAAKYEARFGTRMEYAPQVIGAHTQLPLFKRIGWYTLATIAKKAEKGVHKLFDAMSQRLVKFLDGKGM